MAVRIVTDSSSDLSAERAEQLEIDVVPLSIRFGDEEFTDRVQLSVDEFYTRLTASAALPETAAPSPGAFEEVFRGAAERGADGVVCLTLSSELSATIASAQNAARSVEGVIDVRVIDSRSITTGLASQAIAAADAARRGASLDEVVALVEDMASRTHVIGALDTLEYLKRGGRIGGAQALLGNLLSIKPLLDLSTGRVEEAGKARTRRKALQWLADRTLALDEPENLSICHANAGDLDEFLALLAPKYTVEQLTVCQIGPVIGTHGGPGMIGVTWQDRR